jgi:hypothetical protein
MHGATIKMYRNAFEELRVGTYAFIITMKDIK